MNNEGIRTRSCMNWSYKIGLMVKRIRKIVSLDVIFCP